MLEERERAAKCWSAIASLLLAVAAVRATARPAPQDTNGTRDTPARGVWTDPSAGLM
jgi:hypothetical protein